jgi:hypothetical protein
MVDIDAWGLLDEDLLHIVCPQARWLSCHILWAKSHHKHCDVPAFQKA